MLKIRNKSKILAIALMICLLTTITGAVYAITNGQPDGNDHPYVCLVVADVGGQPAWRGTGILLSPTIVLTAGHVTDGASAVRVWVNEVVQGNPEYPYGGSTSYEGIPYTNPDSEIGTSENNGIPTFAYRDIGIIVLTEPVPTSVVNEYGQLPLAGVVDTLKVMTDVDLVGYGVQEMVHGGGQPYWTGLRNRLYAPAKMVSKKFSWNDEFMRCTANPGRNKGGTAFGDSGGPVLLGGTDTVLAVNSYVTNYNCDGVTYHSRVDIAEVLNWINSFFT